MNKKKVVFLLSGLFLSYLTTSYAEDIPAKGWKDSAEASVLSSNGNTRATTYSFKNTFNYYWTYTAMELIAGSLGSQSNNDVTAELYFANEKVAQKISEKNYAFEKISWEKNRFAGIQNRFDGTAGLGRELLNSSINKWIVELGGGYVVEERIKAEKNEYGAGRAYTKFIHNITPTSNFSQDIEYQVNLEDKDDFRVNTESALTAAISVHFSLKVSFIWKHVAIPPSSEFGRNDTTTAATLIASY